MNAPGLEGGTFLLVASNAFKGRELPAEVADTVRLGGAFGLDVRAHDVYELFRDDDE